MVEVKHLGIIGLICALLIGCATAGGDVVQVKTVSDDSLAGLNLDDEEIETLRKIKKVREKETEDPLKEVIQKTENFTVEEYLRLFPEAGRPAASDYEVGGYDVIDVTVYEEEDLSRKDIQVSAEGYISFPLIGRLLVAGKTTSQIEELISSRLAEGQYLLDAHVAVTVKEFNSKQYMVLGSVKKPGTYPLKERERVLDAISQAEGIDFEQGGKHGMIIRTMERNSDTEKKIVIRIDLQELLKGGNQLSNLMLQDEDLLYIPKADFFYIIGEVKEPGSYPYLERKITIVEAIGKAGGFTSVAARNRTRIVRMEDGREKIIQVKVDAITKAGKKGQDILIKPGDVIVVPESFF